MTIGLDNVQLRGLQNTGKPDEFGQALNGQHKIEDFGKLRQYLNSVSDYSKGSRVPPEPQVETPMETPMAELTLYEGQGSQELVAVSTDKEAVSLPSTAAVFRQLIKRYYYSCEHECVETTAESLDAPAPDKDGLYSELSPKIDDIKQVISPLSGMDQLLEDKKRMKVPRKSTKYQKLADQEMGGGDDDMEFEKKLSSLVDGNEAPNEKSASRSKQKSGSIYNTEGTGSRSQGQSEEASESESEEEGSDSLVSESDSEDTEEAREKKEREEAEQEL